MSTVHPKFADPQEWWEQHVRDEHGEFGATVSHGIAPHRHLLCDGVVETEWVNAVEVDASEAIARFDAITQALAIRPSPMSDAVRQLADVWASGPGGYEPEKFEMSADGNTLHVSVTRRRS